jgi:hypothetical protein
LKYIYSSELLFTVKPTRDEDIDDRPEINNNKNDYRKNKFSSTIKKAVSMEAEESGGEEVNNSNYSSTQSEDESESDIDVSNNVNEYDRVKYLYIGTQFTDNNVSNVDNFKNELLQKIICKYKNSIVFGIKTEVFKRWCQNPFDDIRIQLFNFTFNMFTSNLLIKKSVSKINKTIMENNKRHNNGCFYNINEDSCLLLSGIFYMCNFQIRHEISKVFHSLNIACPLEEIMNKAFEEFEQYVPSIAIINSYNSSRQNKAILSSLKNLRDYFKDAYLSDNVRNQGL